MGCRSSSLSRVRRSFSLRPSMHRTIMGRGSLVVIALVLLSACLAPLATAAVIHVPGDQPTIQAGIDAAHAGDTVLVAGGTYYEHDIQMKSGVHLLSETGQPESVTIDANALGRVIYCDNVDSAACIEGFTLRGASVTPNDYGGGIYCRYSYLTIARCLITDNYARSGGSGVYCGRSDVVIQECRFAHNQRTVDGGGLYCEQSSPTISYSLFYGNSAQFWGGACFCQLSSPRFSHCTIVGNTAYEGGGIWCVSLCYPVLEGTIVAFNTHGGGIFAYDQQSAPSVACCDAFGNVGGNYAGTLGDQTGLNGNISSDPEFCDAGADNYGLFSSSPCLPENNLCAVLMGALGEGCEAPSAIEAAGEPARSPLAWSPPNPLRPGSQITLELLAGGEVSLSLVDPAGRVLRKLLDREACSAGMRTVSWDGLDGTGRRMAAGVYFLRIEIGGTAETRKVILLL